MKMLKIFDKQDYSSDAAVFEKHTVRAIIIRDGKIATQKGDEGDYKLLGGGMDPGESFSEALAREVQEESGLLICPETICEIGEMLEVRADRFEEGMKYVCHSYFYYCDVQEKMGSTSMTESEVARGYHLEWADPWEIIRSARNFPDEPWHERDAEMVRMLMEGEAEIHGANIPLFFSQQK
jgi:8-oxo-dGTP pyrophosphatase MutT (NUDIX family)